MNLWLFFFMAQPISMSLIGHLIGFHCIGRVIWLSFYSSNSSPCKIPQAKFHLCTLWWHFPARFLMWRGSRGVPPKNINWVSFESERGSQLCLPALDHGERQSIIAVKIKVTQNPSPSPKIHPRYTLPPHFFFVLLLWLQMKRHERLPSGGEALLPSHHSFLWQLSGQEPRGGGSKGLFCFALFLRKWLVHKLCRGSTFQREKSPSLRFQILFIVTESGIDQQNKDPKSQSWFYKGAKALCGRSLNCQGRWK